MNPAPSSPAAPGGCARATSAAEARYRVQQPNSRRRTIGVVALGRASGQAIDAIARRDGVRFIIAIEQGNCAAPWLTTFDGAPVTAAGLVAAVDVVVLVTMPGDDDADAAAAIVAACRPMQRSILALVIADPDEKEDAVRRSLARLRPQMRMLVVAGDASYLETLLTSFGV